MTVSEPTRRERKKEETRQRIFDAAIELFREKGFEQTTIDEITERADVGRGTFFNYFPRKEAVLAFFVTDALSLDEATMDAVLTDPRPSCEKIADLFCRAVVALETDPELSRYVLRELLVRAFSGAPDHDKPGRVLLTRLVQQGTERGEIRRDIPTQRLEAMFMGAHMTTVLTWLFQKPECDSPVVDPQPELRERIRLLFGGLTPKGGAA